MARVIIALLVLVCSIPSARANLAPRKDPPAAKMNRPYRHQKSCAPALKTLSSDLVKESPDQELKMEFRITKQTEVQLDGRACRYEEVPNDAVIILLEAASEHNKTILKIHFRSKK